MAKTKKLKQETKVHAFIQKYFMIIVVFAIMLIPSIYTVLFLGSMWDPYGNTGNLPVAIVNEDKSVIYNGKELAIGDELVKNLEKNDALNFNFVTEKDALRGLEKGTYYMVLVIPEDFSANSTTLTSQNPKKMELDYYVNPGTNYIASKFGESAVKTIKESINKSVIQTYASTIYSKLDTIGNGFRDAGDGSGRIYDGVGQLRTGNTKLTEGVSTLSAGCLTLKEGTGTLEEGLKQYTDGVEQVNDGVRQLHEGTPLLINGTNQLQDGVGQLKSGTTQLVSNNDKLNNGADQILGGLNTMSDQIGESLTEDNLKDLERLESGLIELNDGIQTLQKAINEDYKIPDDRLKEIQETAASLEKFSNSSAFKTLCTIISTSTHDWDRTVQRIEALESMPFLSSETKAALEDLKDVANMMKSLQALRSDLTPENAKKLIDMLNSLLTAYNQLTDGVQQLSDGGNQALPVASETLKKLTSGLLSVKNGLDRTLEKDGETGLIEGMTALKSGINQYTDGVSQVDGGLTQVAGGLNQLGDGLKTADAGVTKLYNGTQQLVANNAKLNSGAYQLNDGAGRLYDGSLQIYDGNVQIDDGCAQLMDGANTLKLALYDGAKQIEDTNTGESAADMFSEPIVANETFQRNINTNGEAMSAYMMCAGLWVACLAFCLMFSPFKTSLKDRKTFVGHTFIAGFVAIIAPIIMVTLIMAIDGMRPEHILETYLMAILASVAFMSIVYMLNTLLDSIGSFMLLVFLCLQLSGAAGTYPIELSPKFYQIIHPFMPFTYGVDAFRSTISTGNSLVEDILVFLGIIIGCGILTYTTYELRKRKMARKAASKAKATAG